MKNIPIGEVLKEYGYINEEQLQVALLAQKQNRSKRLGEHLIDLGFITETHMLEALRDKLGHPVIDLEQTRFDIAAVSLIPEVLARKYEIIAIKEENGQLSIATADPLNFYGIEDVRLVTGKNINVNLALKQQIRNAIEHYYHEISAKTIANMAKEAPIVVDDLETFNVDEDDTPVVKLLNSILIRGYTSNASDIHIEPFEDKVIVRMRIDGTIIKYLELSKNILASLIVRIKILSNLDIAEKRVPQDGQYVDVIEKQEMNIRVSLIPTIFGEKVVLRYLNISSPISNVNQLGMNSDNYAKMRHMMQLPHGIIYVTGPTGSGKTTTLYMILEALAKNQVNISTIEDPVEKRIDTVNQMQVNNMAGLTFEKGLRALLRQDPDIIMVGETRDAETASISVRAAITGHLVLSTLHTNDAVSAIVRLQDMGVEPYLVSNSLVGVVAQRLVRIICPQCKEKYQATDLEKIAVGKFVNHLYRGKGCPHCNYTGYKGRIAIHEIIMIDSTVRRMISKQENMDDIYDYIKRTQQVVTLKDNVVQLVKEGVTSIEELNRVVAHSN